MTTNTEALAYDHIVEVALEHGFKLKPQVDGRMALNDYVIDFARAVYDIGHAAAKAADVGEPVAMVQCHGSAEHPLYTADQLAAAEAAARISALCDTLLNRPARNAGLESEYAAEAAAKAEPADAEREKCAGIVNELRMECARRNMPESATMLWHAEDAIRAGAKEASDADQA